MVERVDLLVGLHRAELGGERRAGAPGEDDADHHRRHLARHADADQIGDVDLRAELHELDRAEEREDHADQEADQADDRQRARADLLQHQEEVDRTEARPPAQQPAESERQLAEELEHLAAGAGGLLGARAEPREQARGCRRLPRLAARRYRGREAQQPPRAFRQPARIEGQLAVGAEPLELEQEGQEPAVPARELGAVEHHPAATLRRDLPVDLGGPGQRAAEPPAAGERQAERVRARGLGREPVARCLLALDGCRHDLTKLLCPGAS